MMKSLLKVRVGLCFIGSLLIPSIVFSASVPNTGPQDKIKIIDERHIIEGDFFYLNIPEDGILLPGSVTVKDELSGKTYKNGHNYIAYNTHAEESGFTNTIYVMLSGSGKEIEPIPQGTEVLVSYEYLIKGGQAPGLTAESVLRRVTDSFKQIQDMQAEIETTSTITVEGETTEGALGRNRYTFLSPDRHRIETYNESGDKVGVNIIKGNELYLVNALGKYQKIDMLKIGGISAGSFSQMDFLGKLDEFIASHEITLEEKQDVRSGVSVVSAVPKEPTPIYSKIELYIERGKGVIEKTILYQDGEKKDEIEFSDFQWRKPVWVAGKVISKPVLKNGEYITVVNFKDIKINQGISESEFDPETANQRF